jgi:hypothetical protein
VFFSSTGKIMKLNFKKTSRFALIALAVSAQFMSAMSVAEEGQESDGSSNYSQREQSGGIGQAAQSASDKALIISGPTAIQGCNAGLIKEPSTGVYVCSTYYQTGVKPPNDIPGASSTVWWKPGSVDGVNMPYRSSSSYRGSSDDGSRPAQDFNFVGYAINGPAFAGTSADVSWGRSSESSSDSSSDSSSSSSSGGGGD